MQLFDQNGQIEGEKLPTPSSTRQKAMQQKMHYKATDK